MSKKNTQGLNTLGDYRRAAKDSLFDYYWPPKSKNTSPYDAIKTAFIHSISLTTLSRCKTEYTHSGITFVSNSKDSMHNQDLFHCIKLMEFAIKYKGVQSIDELFSDWPKRSNEQITVFTYAGMSYLEGGVWGQSLISD